MAATDIQIIWDQVSGSEIMLAVREFGYVVRCGRVLGITSANTTTVKALVDVAMATGQVPYKHPDARLTGYVLANVIVRGDSQTTALIWARYQPISFAGSTVEKFAIEIGGAIEFERMERLPDTGEPFNVQLPDSTTPETSVTLGDYSTVSNLVTLQTLAVPRVTKVLSLYGLFASVPANLEQIENRVNSVAWPAAAPGTTIMGLAARPVGYWKCDVPRVRWSNRDGMYAVALTIASKGNLPGEDWSSYTFSQDPTTGKFLSPSKDLMSHLVDQEYAYGIRNTGGGVLKVGLLQTANFAAILSPLISNTPLRPDTPFNDLGA